MKLKIATLFISLGLAAIASASVSVTQEAPAAGRPGQLVCIENDMVKLSFNLKSGFYSVYNKVDDFVAIKDAMVVVQPGTSWRGPTGVPFQYSWAEEPVQDALGTGKTLVVTGVYDKQGYVPTRILRYTVYDQQPQVILGWGIHNRLQMPVRIQDVYPLYGGQLFTDQQQQQMKILPSGAGGRKNYVVNKLQEPEQNGLLMTYQAQGKRHSLVAGGARYEEFIREVNITQKYTIKSKSKLTHKGEKLHLRIYDPYGKRVEPGTTYISPDTFYLDVVTNDPFAAYEKYGKALQLANNAQPNFYTSPILCGWTASTASYGTGVSINNSEALIEELKQANQKGLNKYFKPGIRLEPDRYPYSLGGNTEQGWWSDEVLQEFGHLKGAYNTWETFGQAVKELGGEVVTYSQSSLPSRDFAQKYPEFLMHNDNSLAYTDFFHPLPTIRYDFSDPAFQRYFVERWKYIGDSGISGVKVDYPATSWEVNGGFEDPSYTATRAYRRQFELYREGLGADATIHERVLGKYDVPATDATVGIVDLQRVWRDSSHIEPEMVSRIGLRWYKNRSVFSYYEDAKNFYIPAKKSNGEKIELPAAKRQTILTLSGFLSGKLDLATSYTWMTPANAAELSKIYPVIQERKSPRPVDMLLRKEPTTYVYDMNERWSQVMLINPDEKQANTISAPLSGVQAETGSLGMQRDKEYYIFDFWNQKLIGKFKGTESLSLEMDPMQALIFAVREVENQPQVLSTDRHFMQGMVELHNVAWDAGRRTLTGSADVIGGDPFTLTFATNGAKVKSASASRGTAQVAAREEGEGLYDLVLNVADNETVAFKIHF